MTTHDDATRVQWPALAANVPVIFRPDIDEEAAAAFAARGLWLLTSPDAPAIIPGDDWLLDALRGHARRSLPVRPALLLAAVALRSITYEKIGSGDDFAAFCERFSHLGPTLALGALATDGTEAIACEETGLADLDEQIATLAPVDLAGIARAFGTGTANLNTALRSLCGPAHDAAGQIVTDKAVGHLQYALRCWTVAADFGSA